METTGHDGCYQFIITAPSLGLIIGEAKPLAGSISDPRAGVVVLDLQVLGGARTPRGVGKEPLSHC
jgi:hypothetical protein